jgi:RNase P subunit RPR2
MRTRTADRGKLPFFERNTFPHRDVVLRVQDALPHLYGLFRVHAMRAENEDVDRASLAKDALWGIISDRFRLHKHWRDASAVPDEQGVCARLLYKAVFLAERARAQQRECETVEDVVRPSLVLRRPGEEQRHYYRLSKNLWLVEAVRELLERASTTGAEEDAEEGIVETLARVFERVTIDLRVDEKNAIDAACDALVVYAQTVSVRFRPKYNKGM